MTNGRALGPICPPHVQRKSPPWAPISVAHSWSSHPPEGAIQVPAVEEDQPGSVSGKALLMELLRRPAQSGKSIVQGPDEPGERTKPRVIQA